MRNKDDLECLACPPKYRDMKSFWRYYTGAAKAPFPTIFGRHRESFEHMAENGQQLLLRSAPHLPCLEL